MNASMYIYMTWSYVVWNGNCDIWCKVYTWI